MRKRLYLLSLLTLPAWLATAQAGDKTVAKSMPAPSDDFFVAGKWEVGLNAGAFGSLNTVGNDTRPDVGFAIGELRFGLMVTTPHSTSFLRGNLEIGIEAIGAGIFDGPGSEIFGGDLLVRYNFVQPGARVVPYLQIGGGGVWSDAASDDKVQRLIGSDASFSLEAEVGVRWMVTRRFSIDTALEYRHISNADTADRNVGLNALGGTLGVSFFY